MIFKNCGVDSWVMCFHFRGSIKPIFENHVFRPISEPFHPLYEAKISNRSLSVVYGSITLKFFSGALGTSPHQWFNRGNEIQKKCFLWHPNEDRPVVEPGIASVSLHQRSSQGPWQWSPGRQLWQSLPGKRIWGWGQVLMGNKPSGARPVLLRAEANTTQGKPPL